MEIVEKLNEFFASVFIAEDLKQISIFELTSGKESEGLSQIEVTRDEYCISIIKNKKP